MSDTTPALRLIREMERLERTHDPEAAEGSPTRVDGPMTALLTTLVKDDFDLTRAIVGSANDA